MKSYASVESLEQNFAVCEVEMLEIEESISTKYSSKETKMMDIPIEKIDECQISVREGDIIVVEHDGENVLQVYYKDDREKERRIAIIKAIMTH